MSFRYRLAGDIEGQNIAFDLENGDFRVGSSSKSDLHLPVEGVSREHALLRVLPGGVSVEDSGSRNGTWIDGSRVQKAAVPDGSLIAFGPARLTLRLAEAEEAVVGLLFQAPVTGPAPLASGLETPLLRAGHDESIRALLEHLEAMLHSLRGPGGSSEALAEWVSFAGAEGAWLVRWTAAGPPSVLAATGKPPALPDREALALAGKGRAGKSSAARPIFQRHGDPPLDFVVLSFHGELHGLALSQPDGGRLPDAYWTLCLRLLLQMGLESPLASPPAAGSAAARAEPKRLDFGSDFIPGRSPAMHRLFAEMELALATDLPLLFLGETGVGKDRLVEIFHRSSRRRRKTLIALNCAAIASELFEAELFGIVRGAATGVDARPGALRRAHGGTIFLDEIGEMSLKHQVKLLRALQEKEVQSVGADAPFAVDVRVMAATNQDLEARVAEGSFRADLFYRLSGHILRVPPLRERRADMPALIDFLMRRELDKRPAPILGLTAPALGHLMDYPWPGNIRELKTEISRLAGFCARLGGRRLIDSALLPDHLVGFDDRATPGDAASHGSSRPSARSAIPSGSAADGPEADGPVADGPAAELATAPSLDLVAHVERLEKALIHEALRRSDGHKAEAARLLGMHRNGLRKKMKRLGLDGRD